MRTHMYIVLTVGVSLVLSGCVPGANPPPRYSAPTARPAVRIGDQIDMEGRGDGTGRFTVTGETRRSVEEWLLLTAPDLAPTRYVGSRWEPVDTCPQGHVILETLYGITQSARVYEGWVRGHDRSSRSDQVVIKYANDCRYRLTHGGRAPTRHGLLSEALFLFKLRNTGLVPKPIYLSGSTVIPFFVPVPDRIRSKFFDRYMEGCLKAHTETRFLVQQKAGPEVTSYFEHLVNYTSSAVMARQAVLITIQIIRMLQELHTNDVVHGDIHGSNILFSSHQIENLSEFDAGDESRLVFIDFDFASVIPSRNHTDPDNPVWRLRSPVLLSPWQLAGDRIGPRDDVYRALELMADVLSRWTFGARVTERLKLARARDDGVHSANAMRELKNVNTLFEHSIVTNPGESIDNRAEIQAELDHIANDHLASYVHPDSVPEYDAILAHLATVESLL